jgi:hypothetical protein
MELITLWVSICAVSEPRMLYESLITARLGDKRRLTKVFESAPSNHPLHCERYRS